MLFVISLSIVAYLLGSAPWGLVIARVFCGIDPRTAGSRNTGATNVARLCGFDSPNTYYRAKKRAAEKTREDEKP